MLIGKEGFMEEIECGEHHESKKPISECTLTRNIRAVLGVFLISSPSTNALVSSLFLLSP